MTDKLIGAVAQNIQDCFKDAAVYTESVYQYAEKPCFFVECENIERVEMLNRNYFLRVHVKVIYENDKEEKRLEAEGAATKLLGILATARVEEILLNGRKIHARWENDRLVVRAIYDIWQEEEKEECDVMESIEVKGIYDGVGIYEG